MDLGQYIEYTNLNPRIIGKDVDILCGEAREAKLKGVCIPPFWVKRAAREIQNSDLTLVTVIGFPFGYQMTETKMEEATLAIRDGARELDVVMNLSAFNEGMPWVKIELAKLSKLAHESEVILKVIIEAMMWPQENMIVAAKMVNDIGADFVKTSTGFNTDPVSIDVISSLRKSLPETIGIKASGGIRTKESAEAMVNAGADRIGTSSIHSILN